MQPLDTVLPVHRSIQKETTRFDRFLTARIKLSRLHTYTLSVIKQQRESRLSFLRSKGTGDIRDFQHLLSQPGLDVNIYDKDEGILSEKRYYM